MDLGEWTLWAQSLRAGTGTGGSAPIWRGTPEEGRAVGKRHDHMTQLIGGAGRPMGCRIKLTG